MKKSLLKVAASIVGLLGCNVASAFDAAVLKAPVMPENEGLYYIFDAHRINDATTAEQSGDIRYAFRFDSGNADGTINGTHAKPYNVMTGTTDLTNAHVWKATTADGGTTWSFQNMSTNKWIKTGEACATSANESEKGLFVIEGEDVNGLKVRRNGADNSYWDGNGSSSSYSMVYWQSPAHPIRFYKAVADDNGGYKIDSYDAWNVTYTFTKSDNETFTRPAVVIDGEDAANNIPTVDFFTASGLQESATTVNENSAKTFNVNGTWNFPITPDRVYRIRLRPEFAASYVKANADGTQIMANNASGTELAKTGMWYFKLNGYDAEGRQICTMHSLNNMTEGVGVTFRDNNDGTAASLTESPTPLTIVPTRWASALATDFALKFTLSESTGAHYVNNRTNKFSSWTVADHAYADEAGCVVRASALTEADFDNLAMAATADEINAAKEAPTSTAISALIDKFNANPLALAIVATQEYEGFIGTGLGKYNNTTGDFADKLAEAKSLVTNADATEEDKTAAAAAIAVSNLTINPPKSGHFYRLHYGDKYLSSTPASNGRFSIETQIDINLLNNTTVFYYDGTRFVTYPGGLVMGNLDTANNGSGLKGVLVTAANAGTLRFDASAFEKGIYNIVSPSNNRYLYHKDQEAIADSGTNAGANDAPGYRWQITEVTWLPIPYTGNVDGHFSVCVPVDLNITTYQRADAYTGVIQGSNLGLQSFGDGTLPANTPAVLKYKGGAEHGCVYFEITGYPDAATAANTADVTNSLTATGVYAAAKDADQSYFTANGQNFAHYTDANLPAFAAILKVPTADLTEEQIANGYGITQYNPDFVSITEIEGAANNGKQVIYDLQGRRVQRASKGLYIIDGVKTLVK